VRVLIQLCEDARRRALQRKEKERLNAEELREARGQVQ
jgi:hypothetical protein